MVEHVQNTSSRSHPGDIPPPQLAPSDAEAQQLRPLRDDELLAVSLQPSPDNLQRNLIYDAFICNLILSVVTHSLLPQVKL